MLAQYSPEMTREEKDRRREILWMEISRLEDNHRHYAKMEQLVRDKIFQLQKEFNDLAK